MLEVSRRAARLAEEVNAPEGLWKAQESRRQSPPCAWASQRKPARVLLMPPPPSNLFAIGWRAAPQQQQSFLEDKLSPWFGMIDLLVSHEHHYAEAVKSASAAGCASGRSHQLRANHFHCRNNRQRRSSACRLVGLNSQLTGELLRDQPDQGRVMELKAGIAKARLEYEALETSLYVAHPELQVHRGETSMIKADELSPLLPDAKSALLEYVVTEEETYLFVIAQTRGRPAAEVQVFTLPVKRAELAKHTEAFRQQLAGRDLGSGFAHRALPPPPEAGSISAEGQIQPGHRAGRQTLGIALPGAAGRGRSLPDRDAARSLTLPR